MSTPHKPYKFPASSVPTSTIVHPLDNTATWTSASLGDAAGLTQLGVYLHRVAPHTTSSVLQWHSEVDEWIYILDAGDSSPGPASDTDPNPDTVLNANTQLATNVNTAAANDADADTDTDTDTTTNTNTNTINNVAIGAPIFTANIIFNWGTNTNTNTNTDTDTDTDTNANTYTSATTDTNVNINVDATNSTSTEAMLLILAEGAKEVTKEPLHTGDFLGFAAGRRDAHALRAGVKELVYLMGGTRREHDVCFYPTQGKRMVTDGSGRAGGSFIVENKHVKAWQGLKTL